MQIKIAVLIACHNRSESTITCLKHLSNSILNESISFDVVLFDDGSSDGTAESVLREFPGVTILRGDGSFYWNRSMHAAYAYAMNMKYDAYVWLNDDSTLFPTALQNAIGSWLSVRAKTGKDPIIVGSMQDPDSGELTYGGVTSSGSIRKFKYSLVQPSDVPVQCDTMNGNFVLIPKAVADVVGNMDPVFAHAMGDTDYGLRARKAGFELYVAPGYSGKCARNSSYGTFNDKSLPLKTRWKKIQEPKGLPVKSWWYFTRRHGGFLAPLYWVWPYIKLIIK